MFWRFGFHSSNIETLLDKQDVTLEEVLDEDDLIQECKAHNTKLIEYLRNPNVLAQLLNYITMESMTDKQKFNCEIWSICEAVVSNSELLANFWSFLDKPAPLNPLQGSYFTKVNEQFLEKKTDEMIAFVQSVPGIVGKLLSHIETSAIMDLLLKIISMEKVESGAGVVDWLHNRGLIGSLLSQLSPFVDPDIQSTSADVLKAIISISANSNDAGVIGPNALSRELVSSQTINALLDYMLHPDAPHSATSLTNGVSIIIEVIRKNNSDYDLIPVTDLTLDSHPPTNRDPIYLGDMLRTFADRIHQFQKLLSEPKMHKDLISTTFGEIEPLGFERFRICELYAELLHCSNMTLLNDPLGEKIVRERDHLRMLDNTLTGGGNEHKSNKENKNVGDEFLDLIPPSQVDVGDAGAAEEPSKSNSSDASLPPSVNGLDGASSMQISDVSSSIADNIGEPVVGDYLKMQFVKHKVVPSVIDFFFRFPWNNFLHNVVYDIIQQAFNAPMDRGYNHQLTNDIFSTGRLIERIIEGQAISDNIESSENGVRLGYMGHLTLLAEEVLKMSDRFSLCLLDPIVVEHINTPQWTEYVQTSLSETRTRDNGILGGIRPSNHSDNTTSVILGDMTADIGLFSLNENSEAEADDIAEEAGNEDDDESDLTNAHITNDLPDKFNSSDDDDEDEEVVGWVGETGGFQPRRPRRLRGRLQTDSEGNIIDEEGDMTGSYATHNMMRWDDDEDDEDRESSFPAALETDMRHTISSSSSDEDSTDVDSGDCEVVEKNIVCETEEPVPSTSEKEENGREEVAITRECNSDNTKKGDQGKVQQIEPVQCK